MPHQPDLDLAFSDDHQPREISQPRRRAHLPPAAESKKTPKGQHELSFAQTQETGYTQWQEQRQEAIKVLSHRFNLPLEHPVEVWLKDGVRLKGKLELRDHLLFVPEGPLTSVELKIGRATFNSVEIDSCLRLD